MLSIVQECSLSKDVRLVSCCPNMDLIALSMSDGTLAVNRWSFVWQQVFTSKKNETAETTSLCWSPRGHVLAVGREDGTIDFYNCESSGKFRTLKAHDCAVTTMSWVLQRDRSDGFPDDTSTYVQPPPDLPKPKSFANFNSVSEVNEYKSDQRTDQFPNRMDMLFSGTQRGDVAAHAFGEFPCARIELLTGIVREIRISNDLCVLNVLTQSSNDKKNVEYEVVTLDSSFLWTYRRPIRVLAGHACEIEKMIDHISKTFREMRKNWQSGIRPLKDFLKAMCSTLVKYGRCDSPKEELLSLLASGPSDAMLQLFGMPEHVTSHILKRMQKSCVGACDSLISMIAKYLRPALEVCAFRANDMRGLALCEDEFERIGWTSELADKIVNSIDSCMIKSQSLDLAVRKARVDFDALLMWLRSEWQRYQGSELENTGDRNSEMLKRNNKKKNRIRLDPRCRDILIRMLRKTTSVEGDKKIDTDYLLHDDVSAHLEDAQKSLPSHYVGTSKGGKAQMNDCEIGILQDVENLFETSFGSSFSNVTLGHVLREFQQCWNRVGGLPSNSLRHSIFEVQKICFRVEESKSVKRWCGVPCLHYYKFENEKNENAGTFVLLLPFEMCTYYSIPIYG